MSLSNAEIERRAIKIAMRYEKDQGRTPRDVHLKNMGYDIESARRVIEVKGVEGGLGKAGNWRYIQQKSVQELLGNRDFYVYIVDNVGRGEAEARLYELNRERALRYLKIKPKIEGTLMIPAGERRELQRPVLGQSRDQD